MLNKKLVLLLLYLICAFSIKAFSKANMIMYKYIENEQESFIRTLKIFAKTNSNENDIDGINSLGDYIANRFQGLGAEIEKVKLNHNNANIIVAKLKGKGDKRIMLLCNLDAAIKKTDAVNQDYYVKGDRIYGYGLADGKSSAVFTLYIVEILKKLNLNNYKELIIYVNPNLQEGSIGGSKELMSKLASEQDLVLSFGPSIGDIETILLGSVGLGRVEIIVHGHSTGHITEAKSRQNALIELSHQILQTYDISDSIEGITLNWTIASAGSTDIGSNYIPESAMAQGDLRIKNINSLKTLQQLLNEKIQKKLVQETTSTIAMNLNRPPLIPSEKSLELANVAQQIYEEIYKTFSIVKDHPIALDIGFTKLSGNPIMLGGLGLIGFNPYTGTDNGYVLRSSITPRLYLSVRLIQEYIN